MKTCILLIIALSLTSACSMGRRARANTNAEGNKKLEYTPPEELERPPEHVAEQAKHEKFQKDREEYLKKVNELEKKRLEAIRRCEADKFKRSQAKNSNVDPEESELSCEEQNLPVY